MKMVPYTQSFEAFMPFLNLFSHLLLLVFTYGVKSSISGDSQGKHNDHKNGQHNDQIWHSPFSQEQINNGTGTDSPPSIKMGQSTLILLSQI